MGELWGFGMPEKKLGYSTFGVENNMLYSTLHTSADIKQNKIKQKNKKIQHYTNTSNTI